MSASASDHLVEAPPYPGVDLSQALKNPFGHFDEKRREFVITDPSTPSPWVNYISNGVYHGLISHAGGGFSFLRSPRDNRITRWRYNGLPADRPGRYVYVRDTDSGNYWSLSWQPTALKMSGYECRHGLNYTTIKGRCRSIASKITYFVPPKDSCEIWWVKLRNSSRRPRRLQVYGYVELCLGHALVDLINQPNDQHFNDVIYLNDRRLLMASKRYWVTYHCATVAQPNQEWPYWIFMSTSLPVDGFDGSRQQFIGPWRSEENPVAVEEGRCRGTEITSGDAVAVLQSPLILKPGEEREFAIVLGVVPKTVSGEGPGGTSPAECAGRAVLEAEERQTPVPQPPASVADDAKLAAYARRHNGLDGVAANAAQTIADKYSDHDNVRSAYKALCKDSQDYLSAVQVDVPEPAVRVMLNCWNQYQVKTAFQFSRDASYYHGGLLFGRGFRDSCQDLLGPLMTRPAWARKRILEQAARQFPNGRCYHLYYAHSTGGENTGHSDTSLWLPFAACQYLKETLDFAILDETVPFVDESAEKGTPSQEAPLLDHLLLAIDYSITRLSPRHLAYFGPGDWNDTLDYLGRCGNGESTWVSMALCYVVREMVEMLNHIEREDLATKYQSWYDKVKKAVNDITWDGEWYWRGTNDLGEVIGSAACEEGRIFLNAQSWAVLSGVADSDRAVRCLDSAWHYLRTPRGPKILHPSYTKVNRNIGLVTRCVPGKKENGAVFNHTVAWAILAEALLGRSEQAWSYYRSALPMNSAVPVERLEVEPYVYCEYVTSPDHATYGQGSHSWLTGSAVWMFRTAIDYLLGVRPTYEGLVVSPCIPRVWEGYSVRRKFRNATYDIHFENPDQVDQGVRLVEVDGKRIEGSTLPDFADGKTHKVRVVLGK